MATTSPSGTADPAAAPQQQEQQRPAGPTAASTHAQPSSGPTPPAPAPASAPAANAPASPPLPARHTAATPGPRAAALQSAFDEALARTLGKLRWDKFAACYPTVAARAPNSLRSVQERVVSLLRDKCRNEFRIILDERHVVASLNELESLVSEAARRKAEAEAEAAAAADGGAGAGADSGPGVPPHLLPPEDVLAAHLRPHLAAQQSQLNARLQTTQSLNAALFDEIQAQRREAAALLAELESVLGDISGANDALLGAGAADELARETRAVEVEMSRN